MVLRASAETDRSVISKIAVGFTLSGESKNTENEYDRKQAHGRDDPDNLEQLLG
jgi:hypothetical protein